MKKTKFEFFKNTPFNDFQNTVLFDSNKQRDDYFSSRFDALTYADMRFNFIRDRGIIRVPNTYKDLQGVNYCRFTSDFEPGVTYYAYVIEIKYLNDETCQLSLLVDGIMSFCQGTVIEQFRNLSISRKHLTRTEYNERVGELRCNDDVLKTTTKAYTHTEKMLFKDLSILMQVSCDLSVDFGTVDEPKIETSEGLTFDKITSPVNLYVLAQKDFKVLMKKLSKFAWITQNIRSVSLIPTALIDGKTEKVTMKSIEFTELYTLKNNGNSFVTSFDTELNKMSKTLKQLCNMFDLDEKEDKHLLRNEYTTTELNTYTGEQLFIDNGLLSDKYALTYKSKMVVGFYNEVAVYVDNYKAVDDVEGSFLSDAIFLRNFDDVPIMIDNYNLSLSKSANQRGLAESKLVSNKISSITDSETSAKDKFMNGASLISNLNPTNLFGKFNDEYEFYRTQQAEFKDMALETNTVTSSSNNNSLAIGNNFFGITFKYSQPNANEWAKLKRYYKMFGYMVNDENGKVNPRSMTVCDYVKFKGSFMIPNVDIAINEMIKAQFENGVRFWHFNNKTDPILQNPITNKMR